ncbi:LysR family transcriptional regulator [Eilatimonas milleporae]|uniref:LysR family transcriptional regulator n=1 Tax=Eilatimonas milleporae TaxID=911205 RepID=A0A3M0C044_9PROT|nr:LysR family transcriptional regulator [Eilatimonas milleporae]RMB01997.1 LysR family transcriptional regulator [Eilatimonas milleporae]
MAEHIETLQLVSFLAVAETGSFRKASARLSIGQSAVSRRVQRLEDLLGVSLFERRPSGARLTAAGSCFASRTRALLDDLDAAVDTARSAGVAGNGHLRIGLIASLSRGALRGVFESFLAAHDDVDLCLIESDRSELLTLLNHRRIDAVYAAGEPDNTVGDGLTVDEEGLFLAVQADGPLASREHLEWEDVAQATFVVSAREPGPEIHDYIIRRVSDLGRAATVRRHRLGREGIMTLVGLGLGVSLVADHWRGVQYPNVAFIPIGAEDERIPFSLAWRAENDNPALRRFLSLARVEAKKAASSPFAASQSPDLSP